MVKTPQMALGFGLREDKALSNFYFGANEELITALHKTANARGEKLIYFYGPRSVGRTHLLQGCCHIANRLHLTNLYLPLGNLLHLDPDIFDDLESLHLVCIDDLQGIAGNQIWEEAFFAFFNRMFDAKKRLIISGNQSVQHLSLLPDIVSRVNSGVVYQVHPLSDEEKIHALKTRAQEHGLMLSEDVTQFIIRRCPRDLGSLFYALSELDQASLAEQRKLTIPFVKQVLGL